MPKSAFSLAVVGATGVVGREIIATLEQRHFPIASLRLYASLQTAGEVMTCGDFTVRVAPLEGARFDETDVVFFAAGERVAAEWIGRSTSGGAVAVDTSGLFTGDYEVPVIVPEANAADVAGPLARNIVTSPDPAAVALAVILKPIQDVTRILRVVATTLEPVSGQGAAGVEELQEQTVGLMQGRSVEHSVFPRRIAFNAIPQIGEILAGGMSSQEHHTAIAVRRVLDAPDVVLSITRVQAPLFYGAGMVVNVETEEPLTAEQAREVLRAAPGILLADEPAEYATPADVVGEDATCVGRIRSSDAAVPVLDLWVTIDPARKGSAVNAVQIAELVVRMLV